MAREPSEAYQKNKIGIMIGFILSLAALLILHYGGSSAIALGEDSAGTPILVEPFLYVAVDMDQCVDTDITTTPGQLFEQEIQIPESSRVFISGRYLDESNQVDHRCHYLGEGGVVSINGAIVARSLYENEAVCPEGSTQVAFIEGNYTLERTPSQDGVAACYFSGGFAGDKWWDLTGLFSETYATTGDTSANFGYYVSEALAEQGITVRVCPVIVIEATDVDAGGIQTLGQAEPLHNNPNGPIYHPDVNGYEFADNTPDEPRGPFSYGTSFFNYGYDSSKGDVYLAFRHGLLFRGMDGGWWGRLKINNLMIIQMVGWDPVKAMPIQWFKGDLLSKIRSRAYWWKITPFLNPGINNMEYYHYTGGPPFFVLFKQYLQPPVKPDFKIDNIEPVQVVWDSDINGDGIIDLVADKSTMVRVTVGMENTENLDDELPVEVLLNINGFPYSIIKTIGELTDKYLFRWGEVPGADEDLLRDFLVDDLGLDWAETASIISLTNGIRISQDSVTWAEIRLNTVLTEGILETSDGRTRNLITREESGDLQLYEQKNLMDFYPNHPTTIGKQTTRFITAHVYPDPTIEEYDDTNNEDFTEVTVRDTNGLNLVYIPITQPWLEPTGGYGPIDMVAYSRTVLMSNPFIKASYPIADGELVVQDSDVKMFGSPAYFGVYDDLITVKFWAKETTASATHGVGIVPNDYFEWHGYGLGEEGIAGLALLNLGGVLVKTDSYTTAAHEIAHTYGIRRWSEEYISDPPGNPANGFWVSEQREIWNGLCFMGEHPDNDYTYIDESGSRPVWVDNEDYEDLFEELSVDEDDPDVLLIGGIIFKNGTVHLRESYLLKNTTPDHIIPGNFSMVFLDIYENTLAETEFDAPFEIHAYPVGIIETNITAFAFAITYPENASLIRLQYNDETLAEFNPNTKLLDDAVDSIPDYCFVKNPEQRRNALHNKISVFNKMQDNNHILGAIHKLDHDIKDKLEKWLVDDCQKEFPVQLTKDEIIELVNEIISRLDLMLE